MIRILPLRGLVALLYMAGVLSLSALPGFVPGVIGGVDAVTVTEATTVPAPVPLPVDLGATRRGCDAVTVSGVPKCENGLVCEPADGRCYECLDTPEGDNNCSSAGCNAETHRCNPPSPAASRFCSPCTSDAGCSAGMFCRILTGATVGYCTTAGCSSDPDCPAGFECEDEGDYVRYVLGRPYCRPPEGCDAWIQTMGSTCYSDDRCHDDLEDGWCQGESYGTPGFCTARCSEQRDCEVGANTKLVCNMGSGYCVKG